MALGWGFQLQQPLVVALLALVIFALGLSLSGLWYLQVGIGQRGSQLLQRTGPFGDFFTGVLAVVVASPCTAPFMGSALTFAYSARFVWGGFAHKSAEFSELDAGVGGRWRLCLDGRDAPVQLHLLRGAGR